MARFSPDKPDTHIRFGPAGWLTVIHNPADDEMVALYPLTQVVEVSALREAGAETPGNDPHHQ